MTERPIRRIVVALDASAPSAAALEASARLAAALGVEMAGVYVEDSVLMRLAGTGLIREVDFFSGEARPLRADDVTRQLRVHARRAREAIRRVAEQTEVVWSFHTVRGRPDVELLAFAAEADLIILGERSRTPGRGPGSTVRALVQRGGRSLMIVRPGRARGQVLHVLHDGSSAADEALGVALTLTRAGAGRIRVLAAPRLDDGKPSGREGPGRGPEDSAGMEEMPSAEKLRASLEERLLGAGVDATVRAFLRWDTRTLVRALQLGASGLVVVARHSLGGGPEELAAFLREGGCPVLVVG